MGTQRAHYEPFAWWLARERIGADLREYYAAPQELPPEMLALIERLGASESLAARELSRSTELNGTRVHLKSAA
jgi:hypothetical protein